MVGSIRYAFLFSPTRLFPLLQHVIEAWAGHSYGDQVVIIIASTYNGVSSVCPAVQGNGKRVFPKPLYGAKVIFLPVDSMVTAFLSHFNLHNARPFNYQHCLTLIPAWISNYVCIHYLYGMKLFHCNRWNLKIDKQFHSAFYWTSDYLTMLEL